MNSWSQQNLRSLKLWNAVVNGFDDCGDCCDCEECVNDYGCGYFEEVSCFHYKC